MERTNTPDYSGQSEVKNELRSNLLVVCDPLCRVTPVSKILAAVLFIIMPFLGGWVGYQYAVYNGLDNSINSNDIEVFTKYVPIESNIQTSSEAASSSVELKNDKIKPVIDSRVQSYECTSVENPFPHLCYSFTSDASSSDIINLNDVAKTQGVVTDNVTLSELFYVMEDKSKIYFTGGVPESDACCKLVVFDTNTLQFTKVEAYKGYGRSFISSNNRFVANVNDDEKSLSILDLESGLVTNNKSVLGGSLVSTKCGFAGNGYDVRYVEEKNGFTFGSYIDDTDPPGQCEQVQISEGFISVEKS